MELLLLCLKVFCARVVDVSMATCRTIMTVKGKRVWAALIGFFEGLLWFSIVKEALNTNETSFLIGVAYAGGFATGTYIGGWLSSTFIKGTFGVQVITINKTMVDCLRSNGYAVSVINIEGQDKENKKYMLFLEIDKKRFKNLKKLIKTLDEKAFIVVSDTREVENGYFMGN